MSDARTANEIAIEQVEKKLVAAKREAKEWEDRGLAIPAHVARKIENLKGAANALRGPKTGESR